MIKTLIIDENTFGRQHLSQRTYFLDAIDFLKFYKCLLLQITKKYLKQQSTIQSTNP